MWGAKHPFEWKTRTYIGNDVWIGERATILSGLTIGDGAVIGGGRVVTKNVGSYEIWAGNPAKFIRRRFADETIEKLEKTQWWNFDDNELKQLGHLVMDVDKFLEKAER